VLGTRIPVARPLPEDSDRITREIPIVGQPIVE